MNKGLEMDQGPELPNMAVISLAFYYCERYISIFIVSKETVSFI